VVMSNEDVISSQHLPYFLNSSEPLPVGKDDQMTPAAEQKTQKEEIPLDSDGEFNLHILELRAIRRALEQTSNNRTEAARLLGISRRTLQRKLKDLEHSA